MEIDYERCVEISPISALAGYWRAFGLLGRLRSMGCSPKDRFLAGSSRVLEWSTGESRAHRKNSWTRPITETRWSGPLSNRFGWAWNPFQLDRRLARSIAYLGRDHPQPTGMGVVRLV